MPRDAEGWIQVLSQQAAAKRKASSGAQDPFRASTPEQIAAVLGVGNAPSAKSAPATPKRQMFSGQASVQVAATRMQVMPAPTVAGQVPAFASQKAASVQDGAAIRVDRTGTQSPAAAAEARREPEAV